MADPQFIELTKSFLGNDYTIRKIKKHIQCYWGLLRLKLSVLLNNPKLIVLGSSGIHEKGWIDTEIEHLNILNEKHWKRVFKENSIDALLAEHVWEHLTLDEGYLAARYCYNYLKPGGYLRAAVPDGFHPDPEYINYAKASGTGPGADDHKILFNYKTLSRLFEDAGFKVNLIEYFDDQNRFHFQDWNPAKGLIRRSKMFDARNRDGKLKYTSIILDAQKPIS